MKHDRMAPPKPLNRYNNTLARPHVTSMGESREGREPCGTGERFSQFSAAMALEDQVRARTRALQVARDEAERANQTKSRFVAAVTHDLLQPLHAAKMFLASLEDEALADRAKELVERVARSLGSVEDIVGALAEISRLESNAPIVNKQILPLHPLLTALKQDFQPIAEAKGLTLTVQTPDLAVESDATYLRRILQNLLGNAIQYTATGKVTVAVSDEADMIRLSVTDTGPGIPEERHLDMFREFTRVGPTSAGPGMGLGLTIVERACRLLDHSLSFKSTVGIGTSFHIDIPSAASTNQNA